MKRASLLLAAALAVVFAAPSAHAFGRETTSAIKGEIDADSVRPRADGVYGRFDGDLDLGLGAGARYDAAADIFALGTRLSAHYFSLAGVYVQYANGLGQDEGTAQNLGFGVDVRPLFVPRWATDQQVNGALIDLMIDSLSLSLGAFFAQPSGRDFTDERGFEASLGFGVPLALYASGPWLELRAGLELPDAADTRGAFLALLSWHTQLLTPLSPESERVR
jgi:hypothetical protein